MHNYIFVLWGHGFEETVATVFVTELREAGLPVKLVGLDPGQINGAHGLGLVPDFRLSKALSLAPKVSCIIIPSLTLETNQVKNDPRLNELLCHANSNEAKFVVGVANGSEVIDSEILSTSPDQILVYPQHEDLVSFARELVGLLVALT